jgi:hypothetical protein
VLLGELVKESREGHGCLGSKVEGRREKQIVVMQVTQGNGLFFIEALIKLETSLKMLASVANCAREKTDSSIQVVQGPKVHVQYAELGSDGARLVASTCYCRRNIALCDNGEALYAAFSWMLSRSLPPRAGVSVQKAQRKTWGRLLS